MHLAWTGGETPDTPNTIRLLGGEPKLVQEFRSLLRKMGDGDKVHLSFCLDYVELRARCALVRLAYLALFDRLGYGYILSGAGDYIRSLLSDGGIDALRCLTPQLGNVECERIEQPIVISPVVNGGVIVAYLVLIRTETRQKRHYAAFLPGAAVPEAVVMEVMSAVRGKLDGRRLSIQVRDWEL